ncbi:hypothetical protein [Flavobacterium sp. WV_118_3]|uniref:hypothetical protein n=1 Tax=Flavobacterium sp. WV_118_3 TaxID=3151764 RepID=UPI00321ADC42
MITLENLLNEFDTTKSFHLETIKAIGNNDTIGGELVDYFIKNKDRDFALQFVESASEARNQPYPNGYDVGVQTLMLASYILGLHQNVEDCLKIWESKTIDFDTMCGFDIQLVVFAGLEKTIDYLKTQKDEVSEQALKYIEDCKKSGDLDDLDEYYAEGELLWFL